MSKKRAYEVRVKDARESFARYLIAGAASVVSVRPRRKLCKMVSDDAAAALRQDGMKIGSDFERTLRRFDRPGRVDTPNRIER